MKIFKNNMLPYYSPKISGTILIRSRPTKCRLEASNWDQSYQCLSNVVQCYPMLSNDIQCYLMINNRTNVAKDERSDMGSLPGAESLHDHFFQFIWKLVLQNLFFLNIALGSKYCAPKVWVMKAPTGFSSSMNYLIMFWNAMFREMFCYIMIRVMFCAGIKYHWGAFLPPPFSCHHLYCHHCHHCHPTCKSTIIICITTQHSKVSESISTIIILISISMICIDLDTQHTQSQSKITFHFTRPDIRYPDKGLQESFNLS